MGTENIASDSQRRYPERVRSAFRRKPDVGRGDGEGGGRVEFMRDMGPVATRAKPPRTRRAAAKEQTRRKVMDAARSLFGEKGYEGATIRDIATAAGMSTGAVFANFADKADLFRQIVREGVSEVLDDMAAAAAKPDVDNALTDVFMRGYAFNQSREQLVRAAFIVAWESGHGQEMTDAGDRPRTMESIIADALRRATARGELAADPNAKLRAELLADLYFSNFRLLIFDKWPLARLEPRVRGQIAIVLAEVRARSVAAVN